MQEKKIDIVDYDSVQYDYEQYWKGREYEHEADMMAVHTLLEYEKKHIKKSDVYIDIGGSYGRLVPLYQSYFNHVILFDYSLESLKKAKRYCEEKGMKNVYFIAGDLYFMPFKNQSISAGQMVRVIHHLTDTHAAFTEIDRVIANFFVLEFANKVHAKYKIKHLFSHISEEPMQQVFRDSSQGSHGADQIFLNYHPRFIQKEITKSGFHIAKSLSVSNFRMPVLKKVFGDSILVKAEKILQKPLAPLSFGPSMYFVLEKKNIQHTSAALDQIVCCSMCKGDLDRTEDGYMCPTCHKDYPLIDGVYDFR